MTEILVGRVEKEPSSERMTPEQRVIDFVDRAARFDGGAHHAVIRSAVLTGTPGQEEIFLGVVVEEDDDGEESDATFSLNASFSSGYQESIDVTRSGYFCYVFGNDAGCVISDLGEAERKAIVDAFFIRYRLDKYGAKPDLWRPAERE